MEVLAKKETNMGINYVLVKYSDDFYAHGTEADIYDRYGFPVNACGTKEEVLQHCKGVLELCKININNYEKEYIKNNCDAWKILIKLEQKELEALEKFVEILQN